MIKQIDTVDIVIVNDLFVFCSDNQYNFLNNNEVKINIKKLK